MLVWSPSLHFTLGTQRGKSQMHNSLLLSVGRGASQLATRRALEESASRWTSNPPETPFWAQRLQENPQTWQGHKGSSPPVVSVTHICQEHPAGCTSTLPSKGGTLPENKAGKSLAVQGTTARGGCASWADGAWAQLPTCLCLQPQPGVYC